MDADNRNEETIFQAAIEIVSPQERDAFVKSACGDDAELLNRVEDLLKIHYDNKSFLKSPLAAAVTLDESPATEKPGETIGRYKLLQQIGEGGFGVVYMAEQRHPIQRKVALKIIKLGMDTKQVIARFEAERQALAMMDHPNIAKVLDAGATATGRPYFVMELVKGIPVTEYCDKNDLDTHQRLELFIDICKAVQHAHHKGIIHRDIKPSNILITLKDDDSPVPKVIDFGIAKATQARLTEKTLFTEFRQFIGTPEYMSPEQARMGEMGIDTRSDVYSLGVLLYELLTGTTPFDSQTLRNAAYNEIQRIISEDPPPKPSTRLSTLGDSLEDIAKHRKMAPTQLRREIQGELDWIILKALEKERTRRYGSADELALDIERHLTHQPVAAGPPSKLYLMKKFSQRHRVEVMTAVTIAATVVIGFVVSMILYFQAERAREKESIARKAADNSRIVAEAAREKESVARIEAEQAEKLADEQRMRVQRLLAKSQFEQSIQLQNKGNVQGLLGLLEAWETAEYSPDLRKSIERLWAIAHDLSAGRLITILPGYPIQSISPDEKYLASFNGQTAQLVEMGTWQTHNLPLHLEKDIEAITFSPDSRLLAAYSTEGVSRLWDISTGQSIGSVLQHTVDKEKIIQPIFSREFSAQEINRLIAFSPDGKLFATGYRDGTVLFWDTSSGESYGEAIEHEGLQTIAFSPDSKLIVTGSVSPLVGAQLWDVATGQQYGPPLKTGGAEEYTIFSPDGKLLATKIGTDFSINIWDTKTGQLCKILQYEKWMSDIEFSPDGKLLAGAAADGVAPIWDIATGNLIGKTSPQRGGTNHVAFSLDSKLLAVQSGSASTMQVWDIDAGARYSSELYTPWSDNVKFILGDRFLFSHPNRIWKTHQQLPTERVPYQVGSTYGDISPDGKTGALILGNSVTLWDTETQKPLGQPRIHADRVTKVTFSPDGNLLACGYGGFYPTIPGTWSGEYGTGYIQLWEVPSGRPFGSVIETGYALSVAFSLDGKMLAVGNMVGTGSMGLPAQIFDVSAGKLIQDFDCEAHVYAVAFSPDSKLLATGLEHGGVKLWDTSTGEPIGLPIEQQERVYSVAFSPDGNLLAAVSGQEEETVKIWDIGSEPPYQGLMFPPLAVRGKEALKSFSQDGIILVSRGGEGTAQAWRLPEAPSSLREMQLKTWIALGAQHNQQGEVISVQSGQWQSLRRELAQNIAASGYSFSEVSDSHGSTGFRLKWTPRANASWHHVYFGSLPDELELLGEVKETSFDNMPILEGDKVYWMRVDTVQNDGSVIKGKLWTLQKAKMVGWWKFDETDISRVTDSSGNGLHGEFVGDAEIIKDPERGNVLRLDGDGDYVDCGDSVFFDITGPITITAWTKVNEFNSGWNTLIAKGDSSWRLQRFEETNNFEFACTGLSNNEWGNISGSINVNDGQWHHIAGVYDGNNIALFIDGKLDFSEAASGSLLGDENSVSIGSHPDFRGLRDWNGVVDDVRVFNYALSGTEIATIYSGQELVPSDKPRWVLGVDKRETFILPGFHEEQDDNYIIPLESNQDSEQQEGLRQSEDMRIACNVSSELEQLDLNAINIPLFCYRCALIQLDMGDTQGYRQKCESTLEQFEDTDDVRIAYWVVWTCILTPSAVDNLEKVIELAESAIEKDGQMTRYRCALGAALFRAGQFEEAVEQLTELPNTWEQAGQYIDRISLPYAWFFLAMAHQQLGNEEEAIIWFDKATQWYEEELQGTLSWHRELTLQLFQAEAAQLLGAE